MDAAYLLHLRYALWAIRVLKRLEKEGDPLGKDLGSRCGEGGGVSEQGRPVGVRSDDGRSGACQGGETGWVAVHAG